MVRFGQLTLKLVNGLSFITLKMTKSQPLANNFVDTKPHYALLDGLRGVAALLVVWYHIFEGYQFGSGAPIIKEINHGYLAVDFFFILSGFVISYAYDDRWGKSLNICNFFKRRLIRLHPMVAMGAIVGLFMFVLQGGVAWNGNHASVTAMITVLFCTIFLIPAKPGCWYEIRGNGEMFPLNGPTWSLFFEYIGNILYAILIHRFKTKTLAAIATILSILLTYFTVTDICGYGMFGVGWTFDGLNFWGGLLRMLCPFTIGMLMSRIFRQGKQPKIRGAFWICTLILLLLFYVPYIKSEGNLSLNGVFEAACIIFVFPTIVWIGACGITTDRHSTRIYNFLGDISFPLYIIHYPFMYYYYAWLIDKQLFTLGQTWPEALITCGVSILVAWLCLKTYDISLRKWLTMRFLHNSTKRQRYLPH